MTIRIDRRPISEHSATEHFVCTNEPRACVNDVKSRYVLCISTTTLVVQVERSVGFVCVWTTTVERNDF